VWRREARVAAAAWALQPQERATQAADRAPQALLPQAEPDRAPGLLCCSECLGARQQHEALAQVLRGLQHPGTPAAVAAWAVYAVCGTAATQLLLLLLLLLLLQPRLPLRQLLGQAEGLRHQLPGVCAVGSLERGAQAPLHACRRARGRRQVQHAARVSRRGGHAPRA
jgi:hypothetical protein